MEEKIFKSKTFELVKFSDSKVDIIIPFNNSYNSLVSLLENILRTVTNPYRISIAYNNSSDLGLVENLKKFNFVNFYRSKEANTLGGRINLAVTQSENPWMLVLNPVCLPVGFSWLSNLGEAMQRLKKNGIKIVSPYIQNHPFFTKYEEGDSDVVLENDVLPLYSFLCHRDLFSNIHLLKETDDIEELSEDFYNKMKNNKFKQAITKSCLFKIY